MADQKQRDVWHEVQDYEDVLTIAVSYGISDWKAVYDHEKNAEFRQKRPDPHILYKGDKLWIPEMDPKVFRVQANRAHRFTLYYPKALICVALRDDFGRPYGGVRYEIWIGDKKFDPDGAGAELRTGDDGLVQHLVPVAPQVDVRVWYDDDNEDDDEDDNDESDVEQPEYETISIMPGHLDPVDTVEGIQDRLISLNYHCGDDPHGEFGDGTRDALFRFQDDIGAIPTGESDDFTREKLVEAFGC